VLQSDRERHRHVGMELVQICSYHGEDDIIRVEDDDRRS